MCLAIGVLLGLGSRYGLVRYWWVATKLALLLSTLVLFLLRSGVHETAAIGREPAAGDALKAAFAEPDFAKAAFRQTERNPHRAPAANPP